MRVLLVEDNAELSMLVSDKLIEGGYSIDQAHTLEDANLFLKTVTYNAVILDLGLPDGEGLALLRGLRASKNSIPVLILTARDGVSDRVSGLDAGADDYLLKPFALEELLARLRALLRRPNTALGPSLRLGNLTFDTKAREVQIEGETCAFSKREIDVLEHLLRRSGRVVPKAVFEEALYNFEAEVTANTIEAQISRLRKRLKACNATLEVHTIRGVGYLLTEIEEVTP